MSKDKFNYRQTPCCSSCAHGLPGGYRSEDYQHLWCTIHHTEVEGDMICDKVSM